MLVGQKILNIVFYRKVYNFLKVILCPELTITVTKGVQTNIARLKMCCPNTFEPRYVISNNMVF